MDSRISSAYMGRRERGGENDGTEEIRNLFKEDDEPKLIEDW